MLEAALLQSQIANRFFRNFRAPWVVAKAARIGRLWHRWKFTKRCSFRSRSKGISAILDDTAGHGLESTANNRLWIRGNLKGELSRLFAPTLLEATHLTLANRRSASMTGGSYQQTENSRLSYRLIFFGAVLECDDDEVEKVDGRW